MYTVGVDIGGTKTRVALAGENEILEKHTFETNKENPEKNTLQILKIIDKYKERGEIEGIGICAPGPLDLMENIILTPPNLPGWRNYKIVEAIKNKTGINTYLENDANVAALGEYLLLKEKPDTLQFLTISTGVGGGFIYKGKIYRGSHGLAEEIFNIVVSQAAKQYGQYEKGAIESICSGSAIYRLALEKGLKVKDTEEVFKLRKKGNIIASEIIDAAIEGLAVGIANIAQIIDPEIIVLSGSLVLYNPWMVAEIENRVKDKVHEVLKDKINIKLSKENGDSGLIGAAHIGTKKYNE